MRSTKYKMCRVYNMKLFNVMNLDAEVTYHKSEVAAFLYTSDFYGGLSNMSQNRPVLYNGLFWCSSEHLYHACKFPDAPGVQEEIFNQPTPRLAKEVSRQNDALKRVDWQLVKAQAMAWCITQRLITAENTEHVLFRIDLELTQTRPIVEISHRDRFWGAEPVGQTYVGSNVLGKLLTQLRDGARETTPPHGTRFFNEYYPFGIEI